MSSAAAFPVEEYNQRRANVRALMVEHQVAAVVVTAPEDVYYLSGLNSQGHFVFTALVLHAGDAEATLVAREMEAPTAAVQASSCTFVGYQDADGPSTALSASLRGLGRRERIGYQAESLSFPVGVWRELDSHLGSPTWVDVTGMLSDVRAVRSDREIRCLREAGQLSDIGMQAGIAAASGECPGGEIVGAIENAMLSAGSDYPGFVPLVRSVDQIRQEHVAWNAQPVTAEHSLFFELSGATARYHAPLGRTVRPNPHRRDDRAGDLAHAGLDAIVALLHPGRPAHDVYQAWKTTIEAVLGRSYERHHCGYAVGIGFPPSWMSGRVDSLRPGNDMTLRKGMTFHIQSWVVDQQIGTYAISDTALVTATDSELLTKTPRHLTRP